jgi:hypothetical protein
MDADVAHQASVRSRRPVHASLLFFLAICVSLPGRRVAAEPRPAKPDQPAAVTAEGLHLETPGDVVGRNFKPADLLGFSSRTDAAAAGALAELHPRHHLEVTLRYILSPDKTHDVEVAFEPDEVSPAEAAAIRTALLRVPTVRSSTDVVSFTRTYAVQGSEDDERVKHRPPVWGPAVQDPGSEASAMAALAEIASGGPFDHFGRVLIAGPALSALLTKQEPRLKGQGAPFKILVPGSKRTRMLEGRLYKGDEITSFLATDAVRAMATRIGAGQPRAATETERGRYYQLISSDIAGMPVPVVQQGKDVLLVGFVRQSVLWLELVSQDAH